MNRPTANRLVVIAVSLALSVGARASAQTREATENRSEPADPPPASVDGGTGEARAAPGEPSETKPGEVAPPARLSDEAELERVVFGLFQAGRFPECTTALSRLLDRDNPARLKEPAVVERARVYQAACLLAEGRREEAKEPLRQALLLNPTMKVPDAFTFPPPVIDLFIEVRSALGTLLEKREKELIRKKQKELLKERQRQQRERERVQKLEQLAAQETVVVKNSRWLAAVPFGVGQFQNQDKALGWTLLAAETVLAGTALGSLIATTNLQRKGALGEFDQSEVNARLSDLHTATVWSTYALLAVAAGGILEAQLSFVPERREVHHRTLPPNLRPPKNPTEPTSVSLSPSAGPIQSGFQVGVIGRF